MQHQINHRQVDHGFTTGRQRLVVFAQPTVFAEPAEGSFDNPTFRQNNEAVDVTALDNLHEPPECSLSPVNESAGVTAIRPDSSKPSPSTAQLLQNQSCAIPILDVSRMYNHHQNQAEGIHENVPFTPRNLLSCVVASVPPFSAVLTVWLSRMPALGVGVRPAWSVVRVHRSAAWWGATTAVL
jgi:hypothetical protein